MSEANTGAGEATISNGWGNIIVHPRNRLSEEHTNKCLLLVVEYLDFKALRRTL